MNYIDFQKELKKYELKEFSLNDFVKISKMNKNVAKSTLSRWARNDKLMRIKKNCYIFSESNDKFQIASAYKDCYVGLNSALEYYESTTQRFNKIDLISINSRKNIDNVITFHKIKKKMFFGYEKTEFGWFISNIEKTIIDCIYYSSFVYLSETNEFINKYKEKIKIEILKHYLDKINSASLNKRIGYLLEKNGFIIELNINSKYDKLNINLSKNENRNKKWKLIINEEI